MKAPSSLNGLMRLNMMWLVLCGLHGYKISTQLNTCGGSCETALSHHHQNTKWGNICCKNVVDPSSWAPHICLVLSFVSHLFIHLDYCCSIKCAVILRSPPMILYRTTVITMSASAATIHVTFCLSFPPFSLIPIYKKGHSLSVYQILLSPQILPIIRIILYMHATSSILRSLDSVYHASLHFITNAKSLTHHCILYYLVGWMSLTIHRQQHWYIFIYKAILGKPPAYLCTLLCVSCGSHQLRSSRWLHLNVPRILTDLGKTAFSYHAPWTWSNLQKDLRLETLTPINEFKGIIKNVVTETCACFSWEATMFE